jgi:hypothetical protein
MLILKYGMWKFSLPIGVLEGCVASTLYQDVLYMFMLINNFVFVYMLLTC